MSSFALFSHTLRDAGRLLRRRFATFVLAVLLCASALALPLLAITLGHGLAPLASRIPIAPEVSIFVALAATNQEITALKTRLESAPNVERVQWITRDQSLADLARRSGGAAPLAEIKPNPLPDTLVVTFGRRVSPDELESAATEFRKLPRVDGVYVDSSWYRKAVGLGQVVMRVALFVAIVTLILLALVVVGAVRLIALTDSDELRLLHLVGAEDRRIARPYAYIGGITLFVATSLSVSAVAALLYALAPDIGWLAQVLAVPISLGMLPWPVLAGLAFIAFLFGWVGGSIGLRSALRRIS
jgi:cell division transport system permease protein